MFEKFTNRAKQVVKLARKEAQRFNHNYLGSEHILLGLLKLGQGIAVNALKNLNVDYEIIQAQVERHVGNGAEEVKGELILTQGAKQIFENALQEALNLNHNYVGTEHILLALLSQESSVAIQVLEQLSVDVQLLRQDILKELETLTNPLPNLPPPLFGQEGTSASPLPPPLGGESHELNALKAYGHDLTQMCREARLDPVIGRKKEVERLILILCRRRKNNPVLIGEAGVGKTAIVEGLAQAIVKGQVPDNLKDKKVISLDLAMMVAGTKYRGQFEERIKAVMEEIRKHGNILLFIDEIHTIVGAGAAEGAIDASNILKPALSRGEIQCIGATTIDEFRKHIEKDPALERRFQKITVNPPSIEDTIAILKGLKKKYEEHHGITYTEQAIQASAILSDRYIPARFLPDKAIDLLDEAGAGAKVALTYKPQDIHELENQIEELKEAKEEAIFTQDYEKAARLRDNEKQLKERLATIKREWHSHKDEHKAIVDEEEVAAVVAKQTGIPVHRLTEEETARVLKMEELLQGRVIGQHEAISSVCRAIRRSRAQVKDPNRPIGSFLFLGPTGVGKTLLARLLATHLFGGEEALIQVDMSEYMEKFAVSRMTGSPPGYVGHEEGGQLTERVRQRPYSVVLFDEVEKAHPDVVNLLLQILEEGHLTDSLGRKINFRNTIIIMTSNLGADLIRKSTEIGFGAKSGIPDEQSMREKIEGAVRKHYKPEFINRLDGLVIFKPLDKQALSEVMHIEIKKLYERMAKLQVLFELSEDAKQFLVDKGFEPEMGARPLRRIIERHLEDPLAEAILQKPRHTGPRHFHILLDGDKLRFEEH